MLFFGLSIYVSLKEVFWSVYLFSFSRREWIYMFDNLY